MPQTLRPDSSLGVVNRLVTDATSRYDGVEAAFSWRKSNLLLRGAYTYGKTIDVLSDYPSSNTGIERQLLLLDESSLRLNRGPSDFDIRHLLNLSYVYDLPFFRRNRWLGGWQASGVTTITSGRPYTLYSGTDNLIGASSNRILDVPGSLVRHGGENRGAIGFAEGWTAQKLTPARGALGDIGRNTERGDSLVQWNITLGKSFSIVEGVQAQLRAEVFNLFNTVNYDLPDGLITSRSFGQAVSTFDSRQVQLALKLTF